MTCRWAFVAVLALAASVTLSAVELRTPTVAAFDRYVRATEAQLRMEPFLRVGRLPPTRRAEVLALVQRGELSIDVAKTLEGDREIDVPGGMIHHWVGTVFVPGATIDQALTLLQDYDRHERIYSPSVAKSKLLSRNGDRFRFFLRYAMTRVITVVVNSEHEAVFTRGADRAEGWIHSTRIAEVVNPNTPDEREKPVGNDEGYMWRLNTYWRLLARDGGLYIQCESISLTRAIPTGFGWIVGPFVTIIPKESLTFTLETTRKQLVRAS